MSKIDICGYECEVSRISDFARGPVGTCAFCLGDPCVEEPDRYPGAAMQLYAKEHPDFETCPCCDGRPT